MIMWTKSLAVSQGWNFVTPIRLLLFIVVLAVIGTGSGRAEIASPAEMEQVCENWLTKITVEKGAWAESMEPKISAVHEIAENGVVLARYYSISPRGFVLVPILKELAPIKAYSDESNLDESQAGGFLALIKEVLIARYEAYETAYGDLKATQTPGEEIFAVDQRQKWDEYTLPAEEFMQTQEQKSLMAEAGPLLTSSWHQGDPYNQTCPTDGQGLCVVGCTATTIAQILNYWQWPANGTGSHSYMWTNWFCGFTTPPTELSADFSDGYDWANIVDSCDAGCTPEQIDAMTELCYEAGISVDMDYGWCGSAAWPTLYSYFDYFKYSQDIHWEVRISYTQEGWYQVIQDEIDAGRPMQYIINAHSLVCDGYQEYAPGYYMYHMNYGWGNSFNTWYWLDQLSCQWLPSGICPWEQEYLVAGIHPQTETLLDMTGYECSETGNGNGRANAGETMAITVTVENRGLDADNTVGTLTTEDSNITINSASAAFDALIATGTSSVNGEPFVIEIAGDCPDPHVALMEVTITPDNGPGVTDSIYVFIGDTPGFADDCESGPGKWHHTNIDLLSSDEWHLETYRSHSGSSSWKAGGPGADDFGYNLDACLMTPPLLLPENAELSFWHRIDLDTEPTDPTGAYDGAVVMIAVDNGPWEQLYPEGGYPCTTLFAPTRVMPSDVPCYSGSFDWKEEVFDISSYSGVVRIMFQMGTNALVNMEGWYVDDIAVIDVGPAYMCGDANGDESVDVGDAVYVINYAFKGGPAPDPILAGDANCDLSCDVGDAVYLINYAFKGGPVPCASCP